MSLATKQSLAILGVIHGGVKSARDCFEHGPEMAAMIASAIEAVQAVTVWWPISGDELEHWDWVGERLGHWETFLAELPQRWSIVANISVSLALLNALYDKVAPQRQVKGCWCRRQTAKGAQLETLFTPIMAIHDWIRPQWNDDDSYVYADKCIAGLYRILGFREEG